MPTRKRRRPPPPDCFACERPAKYRCCFVTELDEGGGVKAICAVAACSRHAVEVEPFRWVCTECVRELKARARR